MPTYASTSSKVANAIRAGQITSIRHLFADMSEAEWVAIEALTGCDVELGPRSSKNFVQLDWDCEAPVAGNFSSLRTTMRYKNDGTMFAFEVNPIFSYASLPVSETEAFPDRSSIAKRFAQAVRKGGDVTLGGLVPIASFQHAQLEAIGTKRFFYQEIEGENEQPILFYGSGFDRGGARQVTVHFSDGGRPLGISIILADIRQSTTTIRQ